MEYIKSSFSNLLAKAAAPVATTQSDLFWTYTAGGVPLITFALLAGTTVVLATSTLAMNGGSELGPGTSTEAAPTAPTAPTAGGAKRGDKKSKNRSTKRK
jgi:hypothetical protein